MPDKFKEALKKVRKLYKFLLVIVGTLVFGMHFALLAHPRLSLAAETIGIGIMITTLVAQAINLSFEQRLDSSFQILQGATATGTRNFYPNRPAGTRRH